MNDDLVKRLRVLQDDLPYSEIEFAADRIEQLERELSAEKASRAKLRIDGISIYSVVYGQRVNPETNEVAVGCGERRGPFFVVNEQGEVIAMDMNGAALMDNSHYQAVLSELAAEKALADKFASAMFKGNAELQDALATYRKARGL